jgi:hypothetical protein
MAEQDSQNHSTLFHLAHKILPFVCNPAHAVTMAIHKSFARARLPR